MARPYERRVARQRSPRRRSTRLLGVVLAAATLTGIFVERPAPARAAERMIRATVLEVESETRVVAHYDAFAGLPPMTREFSLPTGFIVKPGEVIDASVTTTTTPWSLQHPRVHAPRSVATPRRRDRTLGVGQILPDARFTDQRGESFRLSTLRGRRYLISFIYTRCQDARMCPLISSKFKQLQSRLRRSDVDLVEVTLDPLYDRPPVLARYGRVFGADPRRWHLLTGDALTVASFAERLGILERRETRSIDHTDRLVSIDANGRIVRFIDDPRWSVAEVSAELEKHR